MYDRHGVNSLKVMRSECSISHKTEKIEKIGVR